MKPPFVYPIIEYKVVDGDNVSVLLDLGFNLFHRVSIRLLDVDAPELRVPAHAAVAAVSAAAVCNWISNVPSDTLRAESIKFGKYAKRTIGDLIDLSRPDQPEGRLTTWLLQEGYVKQYDGGPKHWTDEELVAIQEKYKNQPA